MRKEFLPKGSLPLDSNVLARHVNMCSEVEKGTNRAWG